MWDRLVSRDRDRRMGSLFGGALVVWFWYGVLADRAPTAAKIIAITGGVVLLALATRWLRASRAGKSERAATGALSSDERIKARAKLKKS